MKKEKKEVKEKTIKSIKKENSKKSYNEQAKIVMVIIASVFVLAVIGYVLLDSIRNFEYQGTQFNVVKEGELIFYKTTFRIFKITGEHVSNYNVYLRTDPRQLNKIPFDGELDLKKDVVVIAPQEFDCEGKQVVAFTSMNIYFSDPPFLRNMYKGEASEVGCDPDGKYTFIRVQENMQTGIEQFGPSCYNINVNNCEILEGIERLMLEAIVQANG